MTSPRIQTLLLPAFLIAAAGGAAMAGVRPAAGVEVNLRTVPPGLAAEVEKGPALEAVGRAGWARLLRVSRQVETGGLSGVAEAEYLPFPEQRELFRKVQNSPAIPEDIRLVLQDLIIQYYFFTYAYHFPAPKESDFRGEHGRFLQGLGIESAWVEPAGQNYYQHTFLKKLISTRPESRWAKFYRPVFDRTGFREFPVETEGGDPAGAGPGPGPRSTAVVAGEVREGRTFDAYFGPGFRLRLEPRPLGWEIAVRYLDGEENIARLTPPFHSVPNPREIEGWHFRNSDNSGPNEAGEKNVNAPGEEREFIFSPEVGRTIQGPEAGRAPGPEDIARVEAFGRGLLRIVDYRLGGLKAGELARFEWLRFELELTWPADFGGL